MIKKPARTMDTLKKTPLEYIINKTDDDINNIIKHGIKKDFNTYQENMETMRTSVISKTMSASRIAIELHHSISTIVLEEIRNNEKLKKIRKLLLIHMHEVTDVSIMDKNDTSNMDKNEPSNMDKNMAQLADDTIMSLAESVSMMSIKKTAISNILRNKEMNDDEKIDEIELVLI